MTRALLTFDVYRSRFPRTELGEQLEPIEALDHGAAKTRAHELHGRHVVVIPRSRSPVTTSLTPRRRPDYSGLRHLFRHPSQP